MTATNQNENSLAENVASFSYIIGGVDITFPYKAYPSQLSMMDKIVKSVSKKHNCLMESPTGSGKSLALLCSTLAWQKKRKQEISLLLEKLKQQVSRLSEVENNVKQRDKTIATENPKNCENNIDESGAKMINLDKFRFEKCNQSDPNITSSFTDEDDDFRPSKPHKRKSNFDPVDGIFYELGSKKVPNVVSFTNDACCSSPVKPATKEPKDIQHDKSLDNIPDEMIEEKVSKIYYGTRTHKQITQIIRELKKTSYKDSKMTILSSRNRTCIHPSLQKLTSKEKQEGCDDLLSAVGGPACHYYRNYRQITHNHPSSLSKAWDIEDFVMHLKRMRACPYFSARALVEESDIVFCPYNYLVDPLIRSSLSIDLKNSIVIMDEAHNIEDSAREAASYSMPHLQIIDAIGDLIRKAPTRQNKTSYDKFINILSNLKNWLEEIGKSLSSANLFDSSSKVFAGEEMVAILAIFGVEEENFEAIQKCFASIQKEEGEIGQDEEPAEDEVKLLGSTSFLIRSLMLVLGYIFKDSMKYLKDYRCVILRKRKFQSGSLASRRQNTLELTINFWCLNPAVVFSDIKEVAHCIIVTSGTLSPMRSFQSELDVPFDIKLETNHVVSGSQMWVGTIGQGPKGNLLSATYINTESFLFQDEVGNLVLQICNIIPFGVLCFFPSYNMLEKLSQRWQTTGLWDHVSTKKVIVSESRLQSQQFDEAMNVFYEAVNESENNVDSTTNGALLLAVCRGKVSEGLDFADNYARAVITIGIPFPNVKDSQVELKRKYNNSRCSTTGVMSGNEWYETQAFRALNQALGRCIRHRNDFGALVIVDDRFQKQMRYVNSLSKWIRKEVIHYGTFNDAMTSLKDFSEKSGLTSSVTDD